MSTLIFIASGFLLLLILLSRIPGLEHLIRPLVGVLFTALTACVVNLWAWGIYAFKTLAYSHVELARHLVLPAEKIDPSASMREEVKK